MGDAIIRTEGLAKSFGTCTRSRGSTSRSRRATVFGLLGPNGAGKTTAIRILDHAPAARRGRAEVAGLDVVRDAEALRSRIGLAGQSAAVDENLTGLENLEMVGRLYHLSARRGPAARRRGPGALRARRRRPTGSRRPTPAACGGASTWARASSAVPTVLFLDEPTTGLDPRSRIDLWELIRELVREGTTLLLTTQYLEEADQLADRIAVIDLGTVIAEGTADELKDQIGGEVLEVHVADTTQAAAPRTPRRASAPASPASTRRPAIVRVPVGDDGPDALLDAVAAARRRGDRGRRHRPAPADPRRRVPLAHRPRRRGRRRSRARSRADAPSAKEAQR